MNLGLIAFSHAISELQLIADNLPYLLLTMNVLSKWSLKVYLRHRKYQMYISNAGEVKGDDEVIEYLDFLGELVIKIEN